MRYHPTALRNSLTLSHIEVFKVVLGTRHDQSAHVRLGWRVVAGRVRVEVHREGATIWPAIDSRRGLE